MESPEKFARKQVLTKPYLANPAPSNPRNYKPDQRLGNCSERTKKLRAQSQVFEGMKSSTIELDLSIHEVERFKKIFNHLNVLNISRIYLWIEGSIDCGLVKIDSLTDINVEYLLSSADWGIMGLLSEDMKDYLLLEINEYDDGLKIGLDAKGVNWGAIDFSKIQ